MEPLYKPLSTAKTKHIYFVNDDELYKVINNVNTVEGMKDNRVGSKKDIPYYFKKGYKKIRVMNGFLLKYALQQHNIKFKNTYIPKTPQIQGHYWYILHDEFPNDRAVKEAYIDKSIDDYKLDPETKEVWKDIILDL